MTTRADIVVRRARPDDWAAIWPIFRAVVAGGDTYTFDPDIDEIAAKAAWFHVDRERTVTFVAETSGVAVATALLQPNLPGLGDHVANAGWMVPPSSAGRGIGRAFALAVMDEARALGFQAMQFNAVVADNERALALWTTLGFEIVGTVPGAFRHADAGLTDLHIMHRRL